MFNESTQLRAELVFYFLSAAAIGLFFSPFWQPVLLSLMLAVVFYPWYQRMVTRGVKRLWAAIRVTFVASLVIVLIGIVIWMFVSQATQIVFLSQQEGTREYEFFSNISNSLLPLFEKVTGYALTTDTILEWVRSNIGAIANLTQVVITGALFGIVGMVIGTGVIAISMFCFLYYSAGLIKFAYVAFPIRRSLVEHIYDEFVNVTRAVIKVTVFIGVSQGIISGLVLAALGTPYSWMLTIMMVFLSMMPMFGVFVIMLPAAIAYAALGVWWKAIVILVVLGIISTADNAVKSRLVGKDVSMNEIFVLLATVGGIGIMGAIGMIAGAPAFAIPFTYLVQFVKIRLAESESAADEITTESDDSTAADDVVVCS